MKSFIDLYNFIILLLCLFIVLLNLYLSRQYQKQILVLKICDANLLMSKQLSEDSRAYIVTGNEEYKNEYFEILKIRSGVSSWDKFYDNQWFKGKIADINDMYKMLGLNDTDISYLKIAREESINLVWKEIEAMNWYEGYVDEDGKGREAYESKVGTKTFVRFTTKVSDESKLKKLKQEAIDLLYSSDYLDSTNDIEKLSKKGIDAVMRREENKLSTLLYFLIFLIFVFSCLVSYKILVVEKLNF
jgi:hypothetical protein